MSVFSITERELRVAARKQTTYRLRLLTALIGLGICACTLWAVTLSGASPIPGNILFYLLSWVLFVCACLLGGTLTADCISEEKREGTLGLLFLTNLRADSILLGKLTSRGLVALYSLIGMMPVITIPVLLGGADLLSVFKTWLALVISLLLSLSIGLFASTVLERGWTASAFAMCLLAGLIIGLPGLAKWGASFGYFRLPLVLNLISPSYLLAVAGTSGGNLSGIYFWMAAAAQSVTCALMLGATAITLKRSWQDRPVNRRHGSHILLGRRKLAQSKTRTALRRMLLERNPVLWLCARRSNGAKGFAAFLSGVAIGIIVISHVVSFGGGPLDAFIGPLLVWVWAMPILHLMFCFRIAVAASEQFAADRQSGGLELLLSTPLTIHEIIRGQWLAIVRQFWGGALLLLLMHFYVLNYLIEALALDLHGPENLWKVLRGTALHLAGRAQIDQQTPFYIIPLAIFAAEFLIVVLWVALGWVGMFMALRVRKQLAAPWSALILLAIPPLALFMAFAAAFLQKDLFVNDIFLRLLSLGAGGFLLVLLNALFWIIFCRSWIYRHFRRTAVNRAAPSGFFRVA